jgi:hypothetical protein
VICCRAGQDCRRQTEETDHRHDLCAICRCLQVIHNPDNKGGKDDGHKHYGAGDAQPMPQAFAAPSKVAR